MKALTHITLAACAVLAACATPPPTGGERVVVFLKAKPGQEKVLVEKTKEWMVPVRKVDGLVRSDINVQSNDPSMVVLYYHWRTRAHGEAYRKSELFRQATTALDPFLIERRLVLTDNVD